MKSISQMEKMYSGRLWIWKRPIDTIDRHGMYQMLKVCGVGGKLLKGVQSLYVDSRACVRVGNDVSEWFPANVGFRQGCVMSLWLFNVYMDGVDPEMNVRVLGKGLDLLSANGGRFEINQLLFADDTALVADSEEKLFRLVNEFGRVCERRKFRVNVCKSKVMRCSRYGNGDRMHVILNCEPLEEVDCFKYLWSQVAADGGCERDVVHRVNEGYRSCGALKSVLSNGRLLLLLKEVGNARLGESD